jgi:bile acid:Na+ symporter, BASS family
MDSPQLLNLLTVMLLVVLMVRMGLSVKLVDVLASAKQRTLLLKALAANFLFVPLVAFGLLTAFDPKPLVSAGFLILVVFPGAPFGPTFTSIAKGDVAFSIGLMVFLAALSVPISPAILVFLLSLLSDSGSIVINQAKIIEVLVVGQMAPLAIGLAISEFWPSLKQKLAKPSKVMSNVLMAVVYSMILLTEGHALFEFGPKAVIGMLALFVSSMIAGGIMGGPRWMHRKTMALMTTIRNSAAALVIVSDNFTGTPAPVAVLSYFVVSVSGSLAVAVILGRGWGGRSRLGNEDLPKH